MSKDCKPSQSDIQPEGVVKRLGVVDEPADAEGHGVRFPVTEPSDLGPESLVERAGTSDDEPAERQPGDPDRAHFSDRNLKVLIYPVTW